MPDEDEEPEPIDFSWFYFMGRAKFGLTNKEVGRLTFTTFFKYYKHYKSLFDVELTLTKAGMTYSEAKRRARIAEDWF